MILAAAAGADAALAVKATEAAAVFDRRCVGREVLGVAELPRHVAVVVEPVGPRHGSRTAIISALELLMPDADGRSLSNMTSTPRTRLGNCDSSRAQHGVG